MHMVHEGKGEIHTAKLCTSVHVYVHTHMSTIHMSTAHMSTVHNVRTCEHCVYLPCVCLCACTFVGFMFGRNVVDKDGVSAAVVAAEMRYELEKQGLTFSKKLEELYST